MQLMRELGNYVVNLQRLVHDRVPFCARRGASPTVLTEGKMKGIEERDHFLPGSHMRQVRARAQRLFVEIIERGEPARKEFAINHTLGKPFNAPESHPF